MVSRPALSEVSYGVPVTVLSASVDVADVWTGDADWCDSRLEYRIFSMGDSDASVSGLTGDREL